MTCISTLQGRLEDPLKNISDTLYERLRKRAKEVFSKISGANLRVHFRLVYSVADKVVEDARQSGKRAFLLKKLIARRFCVALSDLIRLRRWKPSRRSEIETQAIKLMETAMSEVMDEVGTATTSAITLHGRSVYTDLVQGRAYALQTVRSCLEHDVTSEPSLTTLLSQMTFDVVMQEVNKDPFLYDGMPAPTTAPAPFTPPKKRKLPNPSQRMRKVPKLTIDTSVNPAFKPNGEPVDSEDIASVLLQLGTPMGMCPPRPECPPPPRKRPNMWERLAFL